MRYPQSEGITSPLQNCKPPISRAQPRSREVPTRQKSAIFYDLAKNEPINFNIYQYVKPILFALSSIGVRIETISVRSFDKLRL
jgi:hypothetical protein